MSKGGRIAGSTLSFIVGILFGILVLVIGVASAAFFIASGVTVYKAQQIAGVDIIEPDSEWGSQTLWNFGKSIYQDYHNLGNLTIEDLQKYGVKIPDEVEGVDLTALYKTPFKDMTKDMTGALQKVLDGITLQWVADKTGLDITKLPILQDQADQPVIKAINNLMGSVDANKMTLRSLADNFGVTLGDTDLFKSLQDAPLANFGNIINGLPLKTIIGSDLDEFVKTDTALTLYVKVAEENRYHAITKGHEKDNFDGDTYMYNYDSDTKTLVYREFRYVKQDDGTYRVSYDPWADDFEATDDTPIYYYSKQYVVYNGSNAGSTDNIYLKPVENYTILKGTEYVFIDGDYLQLSSIYTKPSSSFVPCTPTSSTYTFNSLTTYYCEAADDKAADIYGPDEAVFTKDTRLTNAGTGYIRIHKGTTEPLPQAIGNLSVSGINDMNSTINTIRLGDVITVDSSTTRILQTLENTKIGDLSSAIDDLYLDEVIDIIYDTYEPDVNGRYVQLTNGRFTSYNPADATQAGLTRYRKTTVGGKVDVGGGEMKDVSSQALQALGKSTVKNISDDFKTLAIGDVMDITPNIYEKTTASVAKADTTGTIYYSYDDGLYLKITKETLVTLPDDTVVYYIATPGDGNAIIRKLVYVSVDAMASKIGPAVDDTNLDEVIDVKYDTYTLAADGLYVYVDGKYTLYNPGDAKHAGLDRYTKNAPAGDESSKALQALGGTSIKNVGTSFSSMQLGDVMDITPNQFEALTAGDAKLDTSKQYYKYEDGVFLTISKSELAAMANDTVVYEMTAEGSGHAIMRKLAYVKIDDMSSKLSTVVDDTYLDEVLDIVYDTYEENVNGIYVNIDGRYSLYNPADPEHAELKRYTKTTVGGKVEIGGVLTDVSSKALQALGKSLIKTMSNDFKKLTIGDVMDITPNKYTAVTVSAALADPNKVYYGYSAGVYLSIDPADLALMTPTDTVYYEAAPGDGHVIMRKLAYIKIDEMDSKLGSVVDDTLLSEIIDIYPNDIIAEDGTSTDYLVEHNANYTIKDTSGNDVYYAFVLDDKGSYYLDTQMYELATTEQLGTATPAYYKYQEVDTSSTGPLHDIAVDFFDSLNPTLIQSAMDRIGGYYFYSISRHEYINSYMFSNYVLVKSGSSANYDKWYDAESPNPTGLANVFYERVTCSASDPEAISYNSYNGQNLWVQSRLSTSVFEAYDPNDPNMAGRDIYFFYEATLVGTQYEGYYIASSEVRELAKTDTTIHVYTADFTLLDPYADVSTDYRSNPATYDGKALYIKVTGETGCYYCNVSDTTGNVPKYNKVYCDTIIVRDEIYHVDTPVIGYVANINQVRWQDSGYNFHYIEGVDPYYTYSYVQRKSSQVLCAFDKNQVRVGKLGDALKTFTLGDVVSVEPGSILDDATLLNAKLDEISSTLSSKLSNLTIKEVLVWANISTLKPEVKASIQELTLSDLFGSFKLDQTSWEIKMDTIKLFNPRSIQTLP